MVKKKSIDDMTLLEFVKEIQRLKKESPNFNKELHEFIKKHTQ